MNYASVCDGIGAVHCAWQPLGMKCAWTSEIAPFPSAVVEQRWRFKNHGDFTKIGTECGPVDMLVGGTPCQSFSIAGLRGGMDDERGNLALEFLKLARRIRARWVVFENVPGLLSSNGGKDFGSFIGGLAELGYGWAYRILDAQYAGVPQRRRRIFVVGYFGDWRRAAAVLFERQSVSWNTPPRRKTGQDITGTLGARGESGGGLGTDFELRGGIQLHGHCAQERTPHIAFSCKDSGADSGDISPTLRGMGSVDGTPSGGGQVAVMVSAPITDGCTKGSSVNDGKKGSPQNLITTKHCVRRLTPRECERLQGFPDDYTAITYRGKPAADSNRYKSIGNSFAVPVVKWIGQRILEVEARLSSVL